MERRRAVAWITTCSIILLLLSRNIDRKPDTHRVQQTGGTQALDPPSICPPEERTRGVRRWCQIQTAISGKPFPRTTDLNPADLKSLVHNILVDDKHKVLYCDIAKSGSTTWKHILANNSGNSREKPINSVSLHGANFLRSRYNISQLIAMEPAEILHRLDTYFTFLVVRHPLDRLISTYRDKLLDNAPFERTFGRRIIQTFRHSPEPAALKSGHGVTFPEYLAFVSSTHILDRHFRNYQDSCHPCIIDYDYVVKLETHDVDAKFVIEKHLSGVGADGVVGDHSHRGGATLSKHLWEFDDVPRGWLHEVRQAYGRDMDMFGYSVEERDGKVFGACGDKQTARCC